MIMNLIHLLVLIGLLCIGLSVNLIRKKFDWRRGGPIRKAIQITRILGGIVLIMSPGFLVAGIMGLAAAGPKGPFFFIEQAFYIVTMAYSILFYICTLLSAGLADRNLVALSLLAQAAPIAIPTLLFILAFV